MTIPKNDRLTALILSGIVLMGALLRMYRLASKPLWFDDITSLAIAAKSLRFIVTQYPVYKSAYILVLKAWTGIFGISAPAVTVLPVIFGTASLFLTFRIGKDLCNTRVGLISSFLLSISCFHIYLSQEIKHYTLLLFLILLSFFFFIKFLSKQKTKFAIANGLSNIAILFTHPFGFPLILIQALYVVLNRKLIEKAELKKWFFVQALMLFFWVVWLVVILRVKNHLQAVLWWVRSPGIENLVDTFKTFCYGFNYGLSDINTQLCPPIITGIISVIFGSLFIRGLLVAFKYRFPNHLKLLILWLFFPAALAFLFSYVFFPVYVTKHLLISLPAFYCIVAIGLSHHVRKFFVIAVLLIILTLNVVPLRMMYKAYPNVDWCKPVQLMKDHGLKDDDIIIMATTKEVVSLMYYLSDADSKALREVGIFGRLTDGGWQDSFYYGKHRIITIGGELNPMPNSSWDPGAGLNKIYRSEYIVADFDQKVLKNDILRTDKKIWLFVSKWAGEDYYTELMARGLKTYFKMTFEKELSGIKVYCFEPAAII